MKDLIEELRAASTHQSTPSEAGKLMDGAADAIDRLLELISEGNDEWGADLIEKRRLTAHVERLDNLMERLDKYGEAYRVDEIMDEIRNFKVTE